MIKVLISIKINKNCPDFKKYFKFKDGKDVFLLEKRKPT